VELKVVKAVTSEARLLEETQPQAIVAGMRAVEESHALETRMAVEVVAAPGSDVQAFLDGLDGSRLLRRAQPEGGAKVRVYLLAARSRVAPDDPVPMLGALREETWAVVGEDGQLLAPPHDRFGTGIVRLMIDNLEKIARLRLAAGLRNDASELNGKVDFELLRKTSLTLEVPELEDDLPLFDEGDCVAMRIVNRHDAPLFVYILDLGLTGRISLIYPPPGAEDCLLAGRTLEIGALPGREINLYIPDEFPFPAARPGDEVEGIETLKLMVTTHPTDFDPLFQAGMREGKGPASSLTDLLVTTFGGGGKVQRDARTRSEIDVPEDWTAVERSFRVRRRASARMAAGGRIF
jgi:hypothetical protein